MYAILGDITFETQTSPETFESMKKYDYAEHRVVEARPLLQWISDDLETISLDLMFHVSFVDPQVQLDLLNQAAAAHQALPLVFGNGIHRGYFVIAEIGETHQHAADDGSLISASAKIELKEWVLGAEINPTKPPKPASPPPAIIQAPAGSSGSSSSNLGTGTAPVFNPNAPINPHNLLPTSAIATLGALPAGSYVPPTYNASGVSTVVNSPTATGASGPTVMPGDVPPSTIVS
jgi:phage protein U